MDESTIAKCGVLLSAFMVRRLKRDVLATLPRKTEATVYVPMSATQCELSRQLLLSGAKVPSHTSPHLPYTSLYLPISRQGAPPDAGYP